MSNSDSEAEDTTTAALELRLQEAVSAKEELENRFHIWQNKTKDAVEEQRTTIRGLKEDVQRESMQGTMEWVALALGTHQQFSEALLVSHAALVKMAEESYSAIDLEREANTQKLAATEEQSQTAHGSLSDQLSTAQAAMERYKRRSEQAMRLSQKENERLSEEVKELQESMETQRLETVGAVRSALQRDIAIAALERQVEERDEDLQLLNRQLDTLREVDSKGWNTGPSWLRESTKGSSKGGVAASSSPTKVSSAVPSLLPTEEREALLEEAQQRFDAEWAAQIRLHEEEVQALRDDVAKLTRDLIVANASSSRNGPHGSSPSPTHPSGGEDEDRAYTDLLQQHGAAVLSYKESQERVEELEVDVKKMRRQVADFQQVQQATNHQHSLGQNTVAINRQLERQVATLKEQLFTINQQLLEAKASNNNAEDPEATQQVYLRSVFVKLMSARTDEVRKSLLPVFGTILKLSPKELSEIRRNNPSMA